MKKQCILGALLIFAIFVSLGCVEEKEEPKTTEPPTSTEAPTTTAPPTTTPVPTTLPPLTPPSTPSSGKGNIIGKVYWNDNPVNGAEVKVCEKFSTFGLILESTLFLLNTLEKNSGHTEQKDLVQQKTKL